MAKAIHAAAFVVSRLNETSTLPMQKMLYYAQSCHLALHEVPLFDEPIEAWMRGPVVPGLFGRHRGDFNIKSPWPDEATLSEAERSLPPTATAVLSVITDTLGSFPASDLVAATHDESPWSQARRGVPPGARSNNVIEQSAMRAYFAKVCLPTGREIARDELSPAAFELYLAFAHERAFTPPTVKSEDADEWHTWLDAPPRDLPALRAFLTSAEAPAGA